jgi:predicted PurR-regulated permease PerM
MKELLEHPWIKVLIIATTIAMCSFALRETASITQPIIGALGEVLVPVAVAFALAYVVTPLADLLGRLGLNRMIAAGLIFGLGSLLIVGALILVVPAVIRQSVDLSVQLFHGESYVDSNQNSRFDAGEPFDDPNHNGSRDPALITRFAAFLEESQNRLKVNFGLGLGEQSLVFLSLYEQDTHDLRMWLDQVVLAGRQGRPAAEWPAEPAGLPPSQTSDQLWSPAWAGPLAKDVADAAPYVPEADRARWQSDLVRGGDALFRRHAGWITALRKAKEGNPGDDQLARRIVATWASRLGVDNRRSASIYALELERLAKAGQTAARDLLTSAGASADTTVNGDTVSAAVSHIEESVRGTVDDLPSRLGGWARTGLNSFDSVATFAISVLLIPIYSFFLLLGMPQIRSFIKAYLPSGHKTQIVRITREIEKVVAAFFRGRLLICIACALVGCLGFLVIGWFGVRVPYGMLWGIGIGLATAIPLAGLLFVIPAAALTMIQPGAGLTDLVLVFAVYGLVQGIEAALIALIMGHEVELHPVTLIVALLLCGKLLGVLGLILAVPIAASFRILLREYFWSRLKHWSETGAWKLPG